MTSEMNTNTLTLAVLVAAVLIVALTGCVESRDRAWATHWPCEKSDGVEWSYHISLGTKAAGYQPVPRCLDKSRHDESWAATLSDYCREPMGPFDRAIFRADKIRRATL
jgi:hypothetical protein